jgi:hypothetical protein
MGKLKKFLPRPARVISTHLATVDKHLFYLKKGRPNKQSIHTRRPSE